MTLAPAPLEVREESHRDAKRLGPSILIVFGITGDLTSQLLFPALYNVARHNVAA